MDLDLKEVREYLLETNAVEEAESIILHNILKKSNESLRKKVIRDSLSAADESKQIQKNVEKLDNLRISDLLGSLEDEFARKEENKKSATIASPGQLPLSNSEKQKQDLERLKMFDEVAAQELSELEKKRDWVQLKKLANKYELEKHLIINKPTEAKANSEQSAAKAAPIPFPKDSKETMGKLYELTEEHARRMAENKAQALAFQKEREMLNRGNWSLRTSYLSNGAAVPSTSSMAGVSNAEPGETGEMKVQSPVPTTLPNEERLHSILMSVATNEALEAQRREIALLRERAAQSVQALREDPALQNMNRLIEQAHTTQEETPAGGDHMVSRHMRVPRYLDKWLKAPDRSGNRGSDAASGTGTGTGPVRASATSAAPQLRPEQPLSHSPEGAVPAVMEIGAAAGPLQRAAKAFNPSGHAAQATDHQSQPALPALEYSSSTDRPRRPTHSTATASSDSDSSTQALIARLMEENQRLQQEKESLLHHSPPKLQEPQPHQQAQRSRQMMELPPKEASLRSPERAGGGGGGVLNHFRSLNHGQAQYHAPAMPDYGYPSFHHQAPPAGHFAPPSGGYHHPAMQQPAPFQPYQQPFPSQQPHVPWYPSHAAVIPSLGHSLGPSLGAGGAGGMGMLGAAADPQQQALLQLQQMAEQMERENGRLLSQLGLAPPAGNDPQHAPVSQALPGAAPDDLAGPVEGRRNLVDNAQLLTLERDRYRNVAKPSRAELRHQEEVRRIQQEIEKIKYQGELDIAQAEYEQSRSKRLKELEHEKWLQQQRQELQALKIQQVLAKEQRMLRLHQGEGGLGGGDGDGPDRRGSGNPLPDGGDASKEAAAARSSTALARERVREECGVGGVPVPLDLATGVTIIVDGVLLPRPMQEGNLYRVALGLFDKTGKALVRLTASQWQSWSPATANDKQEGAVQLVKELLTRTLKLSEVKADLANARCLLELQTKDSLEGDQKGLGWAVVPIIRSTQGKEASFDTTVSKENVVLSNNMWRTVLRKGLSDPAVAEILTAPPAGQTIPEAWFLVRILDAASKPQASAWSLADSLFRTEAQAMALYLDVHGSTQTEPLATKVSDSQRLLEKDPEIRSLFNNGSKSPIGFSQRGSAADLQNPGDGPGGSSLKPRGALAAMKAVGLFKSLSKGKGLLGIPEGDEKGPASSSGRNLGPMSSQSVRPPPGSAAARITTPMSPALAAFGGLSRKPAGTGEGADMEDADDKSKDLLRAADDKTHWFLGKPLGPCNDKYQKGDGVDVYIDSAMFLPDNCTLSRVTMRLFTSDKEQVGKVHECYSLPSSPSMAPVFKFKAELRMSSFNMTTTALIRVDTIDAATLLPASVGYACLKLFASRDRVQPRSGTELNACINTGNFQIPLHAGRIPSSLAIMSDTMLSTLPKIPAASLLIRVLPAPKSADGISTLSRDEFPATEWSRLGLDVSAPTYVSGEYSGSLCEPSDLELVSYRAKAQSPSEAVESALLQAITARPSEAIGLPPKPTGSDSDAVLAWMKQLLPPHDQMRRSIEYAYAVPYSIETGLNVAIDRLYNMPDAGIFTSHSTMYKVIASMSPPGLFYKDPPLYDGVHFTRSHGLDAHMRAPAFSDGFLDFVPSTLNSSLYLILDVRTLRIEVKKAGQDPKITLEPPSERKSYWTLLPLCMEKIPGQGHRYIPSGIYHLPLIEGTVPAEDVLKAANPYKELCSRLSAKGKGSTNLRVMDGGGMVAIRIMNPLLKDLVLPEMAGPKPIVHTEFMEDLLTHAITGSSGSAARVDKFVVDQTKLQVGGTHGGKSTAAQLPKSCQADLPALVRMVNKEFETATGLVSR